MKLKIDKSFDRDTDRIKDKKILGKLRELIARVEESDSLLEVPQTKKIEGYASYYRIKIGDYRLGIEAVSGKEVVLLRFLHRKDIYRYFRKR